MSEAQIIKQNFEFFKTEYSQEDILEKGLAKSIHNNLAFQSKCGEIIIAENREFLVFCVFCNQNWKSFPDFTDHFLKNHLLNINQKYTTSSSESCSVSLKYKINSEDSTDELSYGYANCLNDSPHEVKSEIRFSDDVLSNGKNSPDLEICEKVTNNRKKHNATKTKGIVCEACGKTVLNKSSMIRHLRTHSKERPYKCGHCQKGFNYKNHCQRHELLHTEGKIYECDYCYLKFSRSDHKKAHELRHSDDDKKKVLKVGKKLAGLGIKSKKLQINNNVTETNELIRVEDDSVPDGYWRCNICEKILKNSYKFEDHNRLHTGEKPYICDVCGKGMFSQSNLLRHVATHTENRRYRCTQCPAAFYCSTHLKRHEISHSSVKLFHCEICDMRFGRKEHLTAHQVRHLTNRQRTHKCDICEKSYLDMNALRQHKKKHTCSNDAFMCSTCPAVFQLKDALKRHEKRHANKGMYKCDFCPDKSFNGKDDKNQHEKRCHMNELKRDNII